MSIGCNEKISLFIIMTGCILTFNSCANVQAGLYLVSIDNKNGETILQNEPNVKAMLENIVDSFDNYTLKAFIRTGISFQMRRTKLLTHSYYVIMCNNGEYHTLSFYGTKMAFYSEGAWAYDADSDISSYRLYLEGDNKWNVGELFQGKTINTRETLRGIINKINNKITYYYNDHIKDKPRMDNCNTALYETVVLDYPGV